jgi:serine/threonine protein kinase/tetratricopeptide (TPR) repeat protein
VSPQDWSVLKSAFDRASELEDSDRQEFIATLRQHDPEIAKELTLLLSGSEATTTFSRPFKLPKEAQSRSLDMLRPGEVLGGRFRIEKFVGSGGMGEVYRALDENSFDYVAIKTLRSEYSGEPAFVRRLIYEMRLSRRIQHPNVCRVFDVQRAAVRDREIIFLVMEFLEGETLQARLRRGPLRSEEASSIAQQILLGLQAAHDAGVIHRDLKSANVILVPNEQAERAIITDFGLAREQEPSESTVSLFATGVIVGTPAYMAPEQLEGKPITKAVDIHAFGVILFELVTGRHPFEGDTPLGIALRRLSTSAPPPSAFAKHVSRAWELTTLTCLQADPLRRPPTAAAVQAMLEGRVSRFIPRISRRAYMITSGAVVAAAIVATATHSSRQPGVAAERHFKIAEEFVRRRSPQDLQNAVIEYKQAIGADPQFADAWAGLAEAWAAIANFSLGNAAASLSNARQAAQKAVSLAPESPRAVGILGYCISIDLDHWQDARVYLERAVQLDPKRAESRLWYGAFLGKSGHSREAIAQLLAGLDQEPTSLALNQQLATEYLRTGDFDKSLQIASELIRLQPFQALGYLARAGALEYLGRYAEGLQACDTARGYLPGPVVEAYRAAIFAASGHRQQALKIAAQLEQEWRLGKFEAALIAKIYAATGDYDRALEMLKKGAERKEPSLLGNILTPAFRPMFHEPAFIEFANRLHLHPETLK